MKKSVKVRKIIFEILYEIHQKNKNFDEIFLFFTKKTFLNNQDRSMIFNVVLNSIRKNIFIQNILNNFLEKKTSIKIKILLVCAITQILYLDFKDYAVTNDTVEVAKIKKLNPGLINSLLKNVIKNRKSINKKKIDRSNIPLWFEKALNKNKTHLNDIINSISDEPSLHLVFKNENHLEIFNEDHVKTTNLSAFIAHEGKIKEIKNYKKGHWWIQDFSSMLPIFLSPEIKSKKILDMCSAPGGKAFQAISLGNKVTLNDISSRRISILKSNLRRLHYYNEVNNFDALDMEEKEKFDVVILDSPCSGVGTLRRNPEILFKKKPPNLSFLIKLQNKLINKASKLLNKHGILIYMVCSFFYEETKDIRNKFLIDNENFSQYKFNLNSNTEFNEFIDVDGDIFCIPTKFKNYMIDGFYAVKFIKND